MSIEPTRIIRTAAWSIEDYAFMLIRRDVPLNMKIHARDYLLTVIPNIIVKFHSKIDYYKIVDHMRSLGYNISVPEHPSRRDYKAGLFKPSTYHVEKWYFDYMKRREDEDLFSYFKRIGMFNLLIINQLKLTYLEL